MKKVELIETLKHSRGDIQKGSVYDWNEVTGFYEFKRNGIVISSINEAGVDEFSTLFKRI